MWARRDQKEGKGRETRREKVGQRGIKRQKEKRGRGR